MMKHLFLVFSFVLSFQAMSMDVLPKTQLKTGDTYVRVTKLDKNMIRFEKCEYGYEYVTGCEKIGPYQKYSITVLEELADVNQTSGVVLTATMGLAVGGVVATGGALVTGSGLAVLGALGLSSKASVFVTSALLVHSIVVFEGVRRINPLESFRKADSVNLDILADKDVYIDSVDTYIYYLEKVLYQYLEHQHDLLYK